MIDISILRMFVKTFGTNMSLRVNKIERKHVIKLTERAT